MPIASAHDVTLYTLGRGILYIAEWTGSPAAIGTYYDVGNVPKFDVEVTEKVLDHYSFRARAKAKDAVFILETGYTLTFDVEEFSVKNLQRFLKAALSGTYILLANQAMGREYALRFITDNAVGPNEKWEFWKCKLTPNGAMSLLSDDVNKMSFKGEGLIDAVGHPTSPHFTVTFATTTTTTTSTSSTTN